MPTNEKQRLEEALSLQLETVGLDWHQFKAEYGIQHDNPEDDAADRAFFTWQYFRGEHRPQSCLIDKEGRVRGLIIKESQLKQLQLPSLPALEYLCICENEQLTDIALSGTEYPLLQHADWSNNALKRVALKAKLPLLRYFSLRNNALNRFKITQSNGLPSLEELDLSDNRIKNWDAFVVDKMPSLIYLWLYRNPLNESVTTYREEEEDNNYLRSMQVLRQSFGDEKPVKNDTYKVMVVGDGKAGKSCMVKRLVENEFCGGWNSTHGIAVEQFEDTDNRYGFPYRLNLWDFGGQDIYHHTHRMFLQANATYILLWNEETEYQDKIEQPIGPKKYYWENKKVPYWLDYIRYLGQNSPVVVAQTCSPPENKGKPHPDEAGLVQAYRQALPYVSEFLHIDAELDDEKESGYKRLLQEVEHAIDSLERKEYLPAHWLPVREQLEAMTPREAADNKAGFMSMQRNTLELDEFLNMVPDEEPDPMKLLTNWLVPTGVVFYKEGLFDNKIILNQAWAIRAVYALYDRSETGYYFELRERRGRFDGSLLNQCWHAYTEAEREWFLGFMLKAELCFETTEERRARDIPWEQRQFVAVEMLPAGRPAGLGIQERNWESQGTALCQLRYRYPFLHAGIIQSFIARTHHFAAIEDIYKQGMIVTVEGHFVLIEAQPDPQGSRGDILITLPMAGVEVLHRIRKEFEDIHGEREHEEAVRPADGEWVSWAVLQEKSQDDYLPTADGGSAVPAEPYRVFLLDGKQRGVLALSEAAAHDLHQEENREPPASTSNEPEPSEPITDWKDEVRSLLKKNRIEEALATLSKHLPAPAESLERRRAANRDQRMKGTITNEVYSSQENKIAEDILSLLREDKPYSSPKSKSMQTYTKWIIGLAVACIILLLLLNKSGVVEIPGFTFSTTEGTSTAAPDNTMATVVGSVYLNGQPAKSSEVMEVKVKGVNTVNPTSLAGNQFTLRNVPLPSDRRLAIALVFPNNIEEARVFNIGAPNSNGVVDIGELRVQVEQPAAGSGSAPKITILNRNIVQTSTNIDSEGSGNQEVDN